MTTSNLAGKPHPANGHTNGTSNNGTRTNRFNTNGSSTNDDVAGTPVSEGTETYEPIAIIGCAMRLPGGVDSGEALWSLLDGRRDGRGRIPYDRYNVDAFYGPGKQGHVATEFGSVVPR